MILVLRRRRPRLGTARGPRTDRRVTDGPVGTGAARSVHAEGAAAGDQADAARRWRAASYSTIEPATLTFSELADPVIGMRTSASHIAR